MGRETPGRVRGQPDFHRIALGFTANHGSDEVGKGRKNFARHLECSRLFRYFAAQSAFSMEETELQNELASIRSIMERSSKFISLSGMSGILAGIYALVGAIIANKLISDVDTALSTGR